MHNLKTGKAAGRWQCGSAKAAQAPRQCTVSKSSSSGSGAAVDSSNALSLSNIRSTLIRLEDTIIFSLIERAQFMSNERIYKSGEVPVPCYEPTGRQYSLLEYVMRETEQVHGRLRRYTSPDQHPFFPDESPPLVLPPISFPKTLVEPVGRVDYNKQIMSMYLDYVIPGICKKGDDSNYGSASILDVTALQALSQRIHYGKFVAEAKFIAQTEEYTTLIKARNSAGIMELLTDRAVELKVIERVRLKAATFGQELGGAGDSKLKVSPDMVASLYDDWIMPLTKDVEVDYLLNRLEDPKEPSEECRS